MNLSGYIIETFRSISRKGRHNVMKILSLAIGLALGLVLIAKVAFEQSYDGFYNDSDRIYMVMETIPDLTGGNGTETFPRTAGGVAVYLRMLSPEIETSTRFTSLGEGSTFTLAESGDKLKASAGPRHGSGFIQCNPVSRGESGRFTEDRVGTNQ